MLPKKGEMLVCQELCLFEQKVKMCVLKRSIARKTRLMGSKKCVRNVCTWEKVFKGGSIENFEIHDQLSLWV